MAFGMRWCFILSGGNSIDTTYRCWEGDKGAGGGVELAVSNVCAARGLSA